MERGVARGAYQFGAFCHFASLNALITNDDSLLGARADHAINVYLAIFDRCELSLQRSLLAVGHLKRM